MLKLSHTGSKWVHLPNQTPMQRGSRCNLTCIDIQYTPLHANIAYLIYFVCFWCFGRRSAALIKQGNETSLQQIQGRRIAFYYQWLLIRSLQALHNFKQTQFVSFNCIHCRGSSSCDLVALGAFSPIIPRHVQICHGVPMQTCPNPELRVSDPQNRSLLCRFQYTVQRCPNMTV